MTVKHNVMLFLKSLDVIIMNSVRNLTDIHEREWERNVKRQFMLCGMRHLISVTRQKLISAKEFSLDT